MPKLYLIPSPSHKENSRLAMRGEKPGPPARTAPRVEHVRLEEIAGAWVVIIGRGSPMPATDVEVELWKRLTERLA
jgi:hypothetical protein